MGLTCKTHDRLPQHLHVDAYFHCALNSYTEHVKSTVTYQTSRNRGIQKSSCPWRYFSHNKSKSQLNIDLGKGSVFTVCTIHKKHL